MKSLLHPILFAAVATVPLPSFAASLGVRVTNPIDLARTSETIELSAKDLAPLKAKNLNLIHVTDAAGKELVVQAIDLDGDPLREFDAVLFQTDLGPGETREFTAKVGAKVVYQKDQYRAFGRFVRERFDDFAWENDRIAHRTYGESLETWQGEPLSSSTIDIWSKRTPRMVINDWYLADDYHVDHGEGADFYSAGLSRGCGGSGLWADDKLWVSRNFIHSKVLANGPIRVLFELEYAPFAVNQVSVAETKRISLDGGQQFDRFESRYRPYVLPGKAITLTAAIGLKKSKSETVEVDPAGHWLLKWEKVEKSAGNQGLAVITPGGFQQQVADADNHLLLAPATDFKVTYWAGFCWDHAGLFQDSGGWKKHVADFAHGLESPPEVTLTTLP